MASFAQTLMDTVISHLFKHSWNKLLKIQVKFASDLGSKWDPSVINKSIPIISSCMRKFPYFRQEHKKILYIWSGSGGVYAGSVYIIWNVLFTYFVCSMTSHPLLLRESQFPLTELSIPPQISLIRIFNEHASPVTQTLLGFSAGNLHHK